MSARFSVFNAPLIYFDETHARLMMIRDCDRELWWRKLASLLVECGVH